VAATGVGHELKGEARVHGGRHVYQVLRHRVGRVAGFGVDGRLPARHVLTVVPHAPGPVEDEIDVEGTADRFLLEVDSATGADARRASRRLFTFGVRAAGAPRQSRQTDGEL